MKHPGIRWHRRAEGPSVGIAALLALPVLIGCDCGPSELESRCRSVRGQRVTVRAGARVSPDAVVGGTEVGCEDEDAARVVVALHEIVGSLPTASRPRLVVELDPVVEMGQAPVTHVEAHRTAGALLVGRSVAGSIHRTAWLHEIAHVRMERAPVSEPVAERLLSAAEEGVADYYAAAHAGTPHLRRGGGAIVRDLERPPRLTALDWASLSGVAPGWDPHRAGWALASGAWAARGADPDLAEDLVASLAVQARGTSGDAPAATLGAWVERCPRSSRGLLRAIVHDWVPAELLREP